VTEASPPVAELLDRAALPSEPRCWRYGLGSPMLTTAAGLQDRPLRERARYRALLDRGCGKAPAFAYMEAGDPLELSDVAREIQEIADELQARREAKT
jgi:hypothetical protein